MKNKVLDWAMGLFFKKEPKDEGVASKSDEQINIHLEKEGSVLINEENKRRREQNIRQAQYEQAWENASERKALEHELSEVEKSLNKIKDKRAARRSAVVLGFDEVGAPPVAAPIVYYYLGVNNEVLPVIGPELGFPLSSIVKPGLWRSPLCEGIDQVPQVEVVTSFLAIDHGHIQSAGVEGYKPVVFETMIFATESKFEAVNGYQKRYHTYDEAYMGHRTAVKAIRKRYEK